ncbi:hypothetical protein [Rhizobium oryzicola]|uniref:Substrate of the Dot/Icm secretion system n=1 Tax=Rhizobium oryzicola TaxID=1232668 RepID=A0ABT8SW05_9HYPH|nr:hypothetical protein [Rhizobium oryzicola]MDO1581872.1 hypothetical protein [Rhizobium oryzicola]
MVDIQVYRNAVAAHGTRGLLRTDSKSQEVKTFATNRFFGKLVAWIKNPKEGTTKYESNEHTKQDFLRAIGEKYGIAFQETVTSEVEGKSGKPLSLRVVRQVLEQGDRVATDPVRRNEFNLNHVFAPQHRTYSWLKGALWNGVTESGLHKHLAAIAGDSYNEKDKFLKECVFPSIKDDAAEAILAAGRDGNAQLTFEGGTLRIDNVPVQNIVDKAIKDSGIFKLKREALDAIDTLPATDESKLRAKTIVFGLTGHNKEGYYLPENPAADVIDMMRGAFWNESGWDAMKTYVKEAFNIAAESSSGSQLAADKNAFCEQLSSVIAPLGPHVTSILAKAHLAKLIGNFRVEEVKNISAFIKDLSNDPPQNNENLGAVLKAIEPIQNAASLWDQYE